MGKDTNQTPRILDTEEIFGHERAVIIRHAGESYRLLITKQGKLVLNK